MYKRKSQSLTAEQAVFLLMHGDLSELEDSDEDLENLNNSNNDEIIQTHPLIEKNNLEIELESDIENEETNDDKENKIENIEIGPLLQQHQGEDSEAGPSLEKHQGVKNISKKLVEKKLKEYVQWKTTDHVVCDTSYKEQFSRPPEEIPSPYSYFKMFCSDDIIQNLTDQTNIYSCQKNANTIDTNKAEMEVFLGIHLMMGIVSMPSMNNYWSGSTRFPLIADNMSRNRFQTLRQFLHVNDNSQNIPYKQPGHDRLFKIRPLVDALRENFAKVEKEEHLSIDEFIVPFKGRSRLKQYNKNKPHKWGIKVFALCGKSGILYDFEIYTGKDTIVDKTKLGISGDIVVRLVDTVPASMNHKIYMDNWFTSYHLAVHLQDMNLLMAGTIRENRILRPSSKGNVFSKTENELKSSGRGSFDYASDEKNVTVVKWLDNKCVTVISTFCGIEPVKDVKRWSVSSKEYIDVKKPNIIDVYNNGMGGVDLMDMLVELYRVDIRGKRFYLRIIFHLIDICVVNAWLLYRRHVEQIDKKTKYMSLYNFKSSISKSLLMCNKYPRPVGRPIKSSDYSLKETKLPMELRPILDVRYDTIAHWPLTTDDKKRCKLCIVSYSRVMCEKCNVHLCFTKKKNCFKIFHLK